MSGGPRRPWLIRYRVGLGVAVTLLVTATLAVVTWATYVNTRRAILDLTNERLHDELVQTVARVEAHMLRAVPAVELARLQVQDGVVPAEREALARHFVLALRAFPTFSWVSYGDEGGRFTGASRTPQGGIRVSFSEFARGRSAMREYDVDDRGAWTLARQDPSFAYDPRVRPFYVAARQARRRVWVGPYVFFDEGVPGITCAVPHVAPDGRLLGVFSVDFNLNFLSRFIADLKFGAHGHVFVLTPDGSVIAHPTVKLVQTRGRGAEGRLVGVADVPDPALHAFVAAARARKGGEPLGTSVDDDAEFSFAHAGARYIGGYESFSIDDRLIWILGAFAPEADFLEALERNRRAALAVAAAALALGLGLTLVLSRCITGPLVRLAAEMEEVGDFRLTGRAPVRTIFKEVALMDDALLTMKAGLRSFASYVPTDVVRAMLASGQEARLQGTTREVTVYFSDLVSFTTLAETMTPDALVRALSGYLDEMTRVIAAHGGTVDKFIGDAIMAFWGAPADDPDHAAHACGAALVCQRALARLRSDGDWTGPLRARIGVATGDALVGNIGSAQRFNYTVMGDTVNLAARLEGLNKLYGTAILVSETTYRAAGGRVIARPIDLVRVKGKHQGVRVYELLALADEDDAGARRLAVLFEQGLAAYLARDFTEAARRFEEVLQLRPDDGPAARLLKRCRAYALTPPPPEWDGVHVATEK